MKNKDSNLKSDDSSRSSLAGKRDDGKQKQHTQGSSQSSSKSSSGRSDQGSSSQSASNRQEGKSRQYSDDNS